MTFILYEKKQGVFRKLFVLYSVDYEDIDEEEDE